MNVCKTRLCAECPTQWSQPVVKGHYYHISLCHEDSRILVRGSHHVPSTMDKHHYRVQCGAVTWDLFCILNKIKSRNRYTFVCTVHVFHYSTKLELKNMLQMKTTLKILTIKSNVPLFLTLGAKIFMQRQSSLILAFPMFGTVSFTYHRCCGHAGLYAVASHIPSQNGRSGFLSK